MILDRMKRLLAVLYFMVCVVAAASAQNVSFEIREGIESETLKKTIEKNVSALLTEINAAQSAGRPLDFSRFSMTPGAQQSLSMLWENVPFRCDEEDIVEIVSHTAGGGLQVRNIPLELKPLDAQVTDDSYQEAVIDFNMKGEIESFYFSVSMVLYRQVMLNGKDVADFRRRQMILDYVEHFRTAYNQKDIPFLQQVFSDEAIIITGKVTQTKPTDFDPMPKANITYKTQSKAQYLTNLQRVFDRAKYIKVNFSEIKVSRHPVRPDFYGVLLRQGYDSGYYSDDGYVFLLWDFRDESHPQIHVRTWQPYYLDAEKTQVIEEEEIFDISAFDL